MPGEWSGTRQACANRADIHGFCEVEKFLFVLFRTPDKYGYL